MKKLFVIVILICFAIPAFAGSYGQMQDGEIINRKDYQGVPEGESKLLGAGYKQIITIRPGRDPRTQQLTGPLVVEKADRIEIQYSVVDIPQSALDEREIQEKIQAKILEMQRAAAITELIQTGGLAADYTE